MNVSMRFIQWLVLATLTLSISAEARFKHHRHERRSGTVLYQVRNNASLSERIRLTAVLAKYGFTPKRQLMRGRIHQSRAQSNLAVDEEQMAAEIAATGAVEFAEPDYLMPLQAESNDPYLSSQWHLNKINAASAWELTQGSITTKVGVCDTGIQADHPDLAANILLPGFNSVDNTTNTTPIHNHGTWVAGVIAGVGNNAIGVSGMMWKAQILPGRISNSTNGSAYWSDAAECIRWAADQGARVVNLSYGAGNSTSVDSAAQYLRSKGGLLFVAAGNETADISTYPNYNSFVLVGSTDSADLRSTFSNFGSVIDISAPGTSIVTTSPTSLYSTVSGTSFASPLTAGVAGLIFSVRPFLTPTEVENILFTSAKDLGSLGKDPDYGAGRLDAAAAVAQAVGVPIPVPPTPWIAVNSIAMSTYRSTTRYYGRGVIRVLNDKGVAVSGALVKIRWSGAVNTNSQGTTNSTGYVTINTPTYMARGSTVRLDITSITKSGLVYDPTHNVASSGSVKAP